MNPFLNRFHGPLRGILSWDNWNALSDRLDRESDDGWYVYYVGEEVPATPLPARQFRHFLGEITRLLRRDHQEAYLGIIYADDAERPSLIKIYDPNNLGASCGSSGVRVLPGWVISRDPPVDLQANIPNPAGRRRWWQSLFAVGASR